MEDHFFLRSRLVTLKKNSLDKPIPIITGPTASGKSSLAINLAKRDNYTVVSADSRQIYGDCLIGTARATEEELGDVAIKLSGHQPIEADYSVGTWLNEVKSSFDDIFAQDKIPLIAGGTPFYIHSLLNGIFEEEDGKEVSKELRAELNEKWTDNANELYSDLLKVDEKSAKRIEANDKQRVLRALEYFYTNDKALSASFTNHKNIFEEYNFELHILTMEREKLYQRINHRVDVMMEIGLEKEVTDLFEKFGDFNNYNSLKSVGYIEWIEFFKGNRTKAEVIELIKRNSRRYAKRQITFFKNKFPQAKYINVETNSKDLLDTFF